MSGPEIHGYRETRANWNPNSEHLYQNVAFEKPPKGAPAPLDPAVKTTWAQRMGDKKVGILKGLGNEYKKTFKMMGDIFHSAASIDLPQKATGREIGKFAYQAAICPFRVGMAILLDANILLGMVLATPIMAVAKAFPEETQILFQAKKAPEAPPSPLDI